VGAFRASLALWLRRLKWPFYLLLALVLLALGGEVRERFREACSSRTAGWLTRHACDWLDVVKEAPVEPARLKDSDVAERAESHVGGQGETAQGLKILDLKKKDAAELERLLDRDLDGDGTIGRVTPRAATAPARPAAELVLAHQELPKFPRGGIVVTTVSAAGGAVRNDVIPNEVPDAEWLHQIDYRARVEMPLNGHDLAESFALSAEWTLARTGPLYWSAEPYFEKLPPREADLVGKSADWGATVNLSLRCRGFFRCKAQ
jgi:hypothetical protein